jgi:argininosuccinate lyase
MAQGAQKENYGDKMVNKLWGGRFTKKTDPRVEEFTKSIHYDYKLVRCDILNSLKHVQVLRKAGFLSAQEAGKLTVALEGIYDNVKKGRCKFDLTSEDIHTQIQDMVRSRVGELALKLHTARSRNDQVVYSTKMYCVASIARIQDDIQALIDAFVGLATKNREAVIPGYTHMQRAQPIYVKDYCNAYVHMLTRDCVRLDFIADGIQPSMGAGALAGTPIDAAVYKGITGATVNSLDTVSDRDFVIETINALAMVGIHLSRLAEDLIIWSTKEFDFVDIDESFCTGSSLMPQKKNPDVLELIRGYTGRLCGNWVSVVAMMKGLPLAYNRDMQLDKEPLFNSFEIVSSELEVLAGLIKTLKFNRATIAEHLKDESLYATDLVYYLVGKKIPFTTAHTIVGKLVKYSLDNGTLIKDMPERTLQEFSGKFVKKEIAKLFDPLASVRSKKSIKR